MAHRCANPGIACLWLLLSWLWPANGADWQMPALDEDPPDMNELRLKAEAGHPLAQTRLADCYFAAADFTNAVGWYRRAAAQDHLPAQLSLAACLVAGRGAAKDPAQAAGLLRASADLLEKQASQKTASALSNGPGSATNQTITAAPTTLSKPASTGSGRAATNSPVVVASGRLDATARVERVQTLLIAEPELQSGGSGTPKPPDPR